MWPRSLWTLLNEQVQHGWTLQLSQHVCVQGTKRALAAHATGCPVKVPSLGLQCDPLRSLAAIQYRCLALGFFWIGLDVRAPSHFWRSVYLQVVALHQSAFAAYKRGNRSSLAVLPTCRNHKHRNLLLYGEKLIKQNPTQVAAKSPIAKENIGRDRARTRIRFLTESHESIQAIKTQLELGAATDKPKLRSARQWSA